MIKKLSRQFVQAGASVPSEEIEWAVRQGIVADGADDEGSSISSPIYNNDYDHNSPRYEIWKQLLVARCLGEVEGHIRSIFEEVADIAVAFAYPDDMKELIYYMPSKEEGSEKALMDRIVEYGGLSDKAQLSEGS